MMSNSLVVSGLRPWRDGDSVSATARKPPAPGLLMLCMGAILLVPALTPHGHLTLIEDSDAPALDPELAQRMRDAFARGSGQEKEDSWSPSGKVGGTEEGGRAEGQRGLR